MSADIPSDAPRPRLCVIRKWPDFNGYGFNLHAEKGKAGQFIGKVDDGSPAHLAGLREKDRLIEVNGVNIGSENHGQVVNRIKSGGDQTTLLVIDEQGDDYYKTRKIVIRADFPNVDHGETPETGPNDNGVEVEETSESEKQEEEPHYSVVKSVEREASPERDASPEREPSPERQPSPEPSRDSSPEREPSPEPQREPTPEPVREPSPEPEREPSPEPYREPSPEPYREPSPEPVREPSPEPVREPSPEPVREPSPEPEREPSPEPEREPTPEPVREPSPEPEVPAATAVAAVTVKSNGGGEEPKSPIDERSGLQLNMSVEEMKKKLAVGKKRDAKKKEGTFQQKYLEFQRL